MIVWHLLSAIAFVVLLFAYVIFIWCAGLIGRIALNKRWWNMLSAAPNRRALWRSINTLIYWIGFIALLISFATGLLLDIFPALLPYSLMSIIHQYAAWILPVYLILHVIALIVMGGVGYLLKLFRPRLAFGLAALVSMIAGVFAATLFISMEATVTTQNLRVTHAQNSPILDGLSEDPVWQLAQKVSVMTNRGANLPDGEVSVSIHAVHQNGFIYFLIQWPDSTRSQKHLPLVKTENGWKVQQSEYSIQDEDDYYEDKFGIMLSRNGCIAGNHSIHMGESPLKGKPGPSGGRGLHYTTDGSIIDVWHWKSVRTGNSVMNQIDDNYFGAPMKPKEGKRYTGGYNKDPKEDGGYEMNWKSYSDSVVIPKYLPSDPEILDQFQSIDLAPTVGDDIALFLNKTDVIAYDQSHDTLENFPVGTIMPAVVVKKPMTGDRGDVTSVSKWKNGLWTMEIQRKLDTGSDYDVSFDFKKATYLWVSAFDHTQTRHSRHLYPVKVTLQ